MSGEDNKVRLGGLWSHESKRGYQYLSGNLGQGRLLIFPNNHKRGENDPDYILYVAQKPKKKDAPPDGADYEDDNIPF